jgi:hypothetical protein
MIARFQPSARKLIAGLGADPSRPEARGAVVQGTQAARPLWREFLAALMRSLGAMSV